MATWSEQIADETVKEFSLKPELAKTFPTQAEAYKAFADCATELRERSRVEGQLFDSVLQGTSLSQLEGSKKMTSVKHHAGEMEFAWRNIVLNVNKFTNVKSGNAKGKETYRELLRLLGHMRQGTHMEVGEEVAPGLIVPEEFTRLLVKLPHRCREPFIKNRDLG